MANEILGEVKINEDITEEEVQQEADTIQAKLFGGVEMNVNNADRVKEDIANNEAVQRGLSVETALAQIDKLQEGHTYKINNAGVMKFTGQYNNEGMPLFESVSENKGNTQEISLTNKFDDVTESYVPKNLSRNSGQEIIKSKEFQDIYNGNIKESTIRRLLNQEAINEDIEDVKDVIVKIGTKYKGDTPLKDKYIYGGSTAIENGKVVIYTNTKDLSPEEVRNNLFHELQHARQRQAALDGDIEAQKELDNIKQALREGNFEEYENSNYEKQAEFSKQFLLNKLEEYDNEANRKTNEGMGRSYELSDSDGRKDRNANERGYGLETSKKSSLGRASTDSEESSGRNRQSKLIEKAETVEDELEVPEIVADKIIRGESMFGKLYTEWVDRYTPIENLVKKAEQKLELTGGEKLDTSSNPYFQARMYAGLVESIKEQVNDKTFIKKDGKIKITGEGFLPVINGYVEQIKDVEPNYDKAIEDLSDYLIANRYLLDLKDRDGYEATEEQKLKAV